MDHCPKEIKNNVEIFQGDIRDPSGVRKALADCDKVLHLAALIAIPIHIIPLIHMWTRIFEEH